MKDNVYDGYRAFDYLQAGEDYRAFELTRELGRVGSLVVEVSGEQERRVQRLLDDNIVVSLHDHPAVFPSNSEEYIAYNQEGRAVIAYEGLAQSGLDCVFDNMMDGTTIITSKQGWKWMDVIHDLGMRASDIDHQDYVVVARRVDDIVAARENGQLAFVFTMESSTPIENELERIEILYGLGVRSMGITYSQGNQLGAGLSEPRDGGLTMFGREAVRRMNKLGMLIDVSHCGDQTALDTIEYSEKPIVISHAGARGVWDSRRMFPDDVIAACAERGGLIGIEAAPHTTLSSKHPRHTIKSVMDHFEYLVELMGIESVTFGPDTLYGDHVAVHNIFAPYFSNKKTRKKLDHPRVPYVAGMENPTECFPNIVRWLVKHNYSDDEIAAVIGGNTLRLLGNVWAR